MEESNDYKKAVLDICEKNRSGLHHLVTHVTRCRDSQELATLAKMKSPMIRVSVALNVHTSQETRDSLMNDKVRGVQLAAESPDYFSEYHLRTVNEKQHASYREYLASYLLL